MRGIIVTGFALIMAGLLVLSATAAGPYGREYSSSTDIIKYKVTSQTDSFHPAINEISPEGADIEVSFHDVTGFIYGTQVPIYRNVTLDSAGDIISTLGDADSTITVRDGQVLKTDIKCKLIMIKRSVASAVQIHTYH